MKLHPAYLWIGNENELHELTYAFLKKNLCLQQGCDACARCNGIDRRQHHNLMWITPENAYTLSLLEGVMQTIVFALEPEQHFFIVFDRAELFNQACANSLLKSLEEPPAGYHFILLANRLEGILPTIRSRCVVDILRSQEAAEMHTLAPYFMPALLTKAPDFIRELDRARIPEREIPALLDTITSYWYEQLKLAYEKCVDVQVSTIQSHIRLLEEARSLPPMPGSSKLFLKNIFLALTRRY